jgi:hypothetical protein
MVMQGLPQRQLTQLPSAEETSLLNNLVFEGYLKSLGTVEIGPSLQEGTGALGARWRDARCCEGAVQEETQRAGHHHKAHAL